MAEYEPFNLIKAEKSRLKERRPGPVL